MYPNYVMSSSIVSSHLGLVYNQEEWQEPVGIGEPLEMLWLVTNNEKSYPTLRILFYNPWFVAVALQYIPDTSHQSDF